MTYFARAFQRRITLQDRFYARIIGMFPMLFSMSIRHKYHFQLLRSTGSLGLKVSSHKDKTDRRVGPIWQIGPILEILVRPSGVRPWEQLWGSGQQLLSSLILLMLPTREHESRGRQKSQLFSESHANFHNTEGLFGWSWGSLPFFSSWRVWHGHDVCRFLLWRHHVHALLVH